ncbi:maleylpyruvate isomerase family mycothiol-dependent enzyme [Streptomyces violaceus]|uniref:Maleylpyruvate isomerase family mycothiol-dependent enzyme n=1 Tax=Streptomyces violaceus TaxID=1936 RepID=A0ABZ1P3V8_STRVL|nr:maleylpyruvate isomerase family mycothiol-dependent enzyme [Streptomyces violaceus]
MTDRHDLTVTLPWMREGTALLLGVSDGLTDADLSTPSTLPGWTRAHVIGHVARNAEALGRLAAWARTGVPTPMYADREQRAAEIESSAALPPAVLRQDLTSTAAGLENALEALDPTTWRAEVKSALGRAIPAAEIPWMRVREVWLHAVDLAAGATFADLPAGLVDTLLDDVTGTLSTRPHCPAVRLAPTDREAGWRLGSATAEAPTTAEAPAADLLAWVTGRGVPAAAVALPSWL